MPHPDRLPPNAPDAEQAILGCILLEPACVRRCAERFSGSQPFYDLPNRTIFNACQAIDREGGAIDLITLADHLRSGRMLDQVGGMAYLAQLPDRTPTAANLEHYLAIVWEKHLARALLRNNAEIRDQVLGADGITEPILARTRILQEQFEAELSRGTVTPRYLKPAGDYCEEVWDKFFGIHSNEVPGLDLPIEFKLKIRAGECTLVTGDDGSGKSTFLNYALLWLAQQGAKCCEASLEMPPAKTLWMLICQLLGTRELPDSDGGRKLFALASSWLAHRFAFYSYLGIADWRDILDSFRYAARSLGVTVFVLDSVMRIGIPDDDYAAQGLAAAQFARFAQEHNVHLFLVIHENKGADKGKAKVRGSKLWTANVDNVLKIERNMDKGSKLDELWNDLQEQRRKSKPDEVVIKSIQEKYATLKTKWDAHAVLLKQRYPGTQQNASKYFYYDGRCFQYREKREEVASNWLARWKAPAETAPAPPESPEPLPSPTQEELAT